MATSKKLWQLVNSEGQNPLDIRYGDSLMGDTASQDVWNYCDFDLDSHGSIKTISDQDATVQSTLKCIFTEKQSSGYGTSIFSLIGEKDVVVRRVSLLIDITMALLAVKGFLDAQAVAQDLTAADLITSISKFSVTEDEADPSISRVQLSILTNAGAEVAIGVL